MLPSAPMRRVPLQIGVGRLLGGLDLAATLNAGRPGAERGLLAEVDGGVALVAMAERIETGVAAKIAAALDHGEIRIERDGFSTLLPTRFGVVALDESAHDDESVPATLVERLAFLVDLGDLPLREAIEPPPDLAHRLADLPAIPDFCPRARAAADRSMRPVSMRADSVPVRPDLGS